MTSGASGIAVLSLACRFPEAADAATLWANVLDGRRSFRPLPDTRLPLDDYAVERVGLADSIPRIPAGLIADWHFDRTAFHVPRATFEATDLTHWLTLQTVAEALAPLGGGAILPPDRTIVVVGNSLTGEFSRSAQLRLRLPYLARRLRDGLAARGADPEAIATALAALGETVAADFPEPNEESLAGALANTIAGRVANLFDLHGGAWSVDGACASSLLALADACTRLTEGSADAAVVAGVDLSLDPFELVGFARTGALSTGVMRVFDQRADGFWPGEGCGVAVLASGDLARRIGAEPLAWLRGWGVATDGAGGLTRPAIAGQRRALERAWARAGRDPLGAGYFEAHGTGTAIGDPTEIAALAGFLGPDARQVPVGSIKANIGHCKAASGLAGFIKTAEALREGVVPPHVSCEVPHRIFAETGHRLVPAQTAEWAGPRLAGVSGFGFGGVNAHLVLEAAAPLPPTRRPLPRPPLPQDAELVMFSGASVAELRAAVEHLARRAPSLTLAEMTDAAARAARRVDLRHRWRAAVVARDPRELAAALDRLVLDLTRTPPAPLKAPARVGLLFPGQAAPVRASGGIWAQRFPALSGLLDLVPEGAEAAGAETRTAQPAILASSLAALSVLSDGGIHAEAAAGHSLGEIAALAWAGVLDPDRAVTLAICRGALMAQHGRAGGAMLSVPLDRAAAAELAVRHGLTVACLNGPGETVLAGSAAAVAAAANAIGAAARQLRVSHAFHSPDMAAAGLAFAAALNGCPLAPPRRPVVSTVTGGVLAPDADLPALLARQLTAPVRFTEALADLAQRCDLLVECGPGAGLSRLASDTGMTCLALDACGPSLSGLLETLAELWRRGVAMNPDLLFRDRATRELSLPAPSLLASPCGRTGGWPAEADAVAAARTPAPMVAPASPAPDAPGTGAGVLQVVREVIAETAGLPVAAVRPSARLLGDLHLNSLSVGRIVTAAAARLGIVAPAAATDASAFSVDMLAAHLEELASLAPDPGAAPGRIEGVAPWVAEYRQIFRPVAAPPAASGGWQVFGSLPEDGPAVVPPDPDRALVVLTASDGAALSETAARVLWCRLKAARAAGVREVAVLHHGLAVEGVLRSLEREGVFGRVTAVDMADAPGDWSRALGLADLTGSWKLGCDGSVARLMLQPGPAGPTSGRVPVLGPGDVILVTGGAGGIGAECALFLGQTAGARLVLAGRRGATDPSVAAMLERCTAAGVVARYLQMDLADPASIRDGLARLDAEGQRPGVILHAAGGNEPRRFDDLTEADLTRTLAPKSGGLRCLLDGLPAGALRLVIGFGSIIGALGLEGESHYALANDLQSALLADWGVATGVPVLALDWSVWAGAGMGERLGVVERLGFSGIDALPLDMALNRLGALVAGAAGAGRMIVTSRFGPPPQAVFDAPPLPLWRFLETPVLHYPGVELIAEAELSPGSDPWLDDHVIDGVCVVPGALLMEAMAQAAEALTGQPVGGFDDLRFDAAVGTGGGSVRLRIAALAGADRRVRVVVRSSEDGFAVDRAAATLVPRESSGSQSASVDVAPTGTWMAGPLYHALWFNAGRFQRIDALERISAFAMCARLAPAKADPDSAWFGPYLPQDLRLGDPGARDAGLHMLQACAPQRRVVPVSVQQLRILDPIAPRVRVLAREVRSDDRDFVFDIRWCDAAGRTLEFWSGARFRSVGRRDTSMLPGWMLPAVLERAAALRGVNPAPLCAIAEGDGPAARAAVSATLGLDPAAARGDGKPLTRDGRNLALSHDGGWLLAVAGPRVAACDLVAAGDAAWAALSPADRDLARYLVERAGLARGIAAATAWAGRECLRKAGLPAGAPLTAIRLGAPGDLVLRGGSLGILILPGPGGGVAALAVTDDAERGAGVFADAKEAV